MLSLNLDDATHWTDLLEAFGVMLSTTKDAADVESILQRTLTKTIHLLRLVASEWNQERSERQNVLSPEIWATCFSFLSLDDRIRVSHVSRAWRATALAFPRLWSHIDLPANKANTRLDRAMTRRISRGMLHLAVSRAAQCPLDIVIADECVDFSLDGTSDLLLRNMHRIRTFSTTEVPLGLLEQPASLLEDLSFADSSVIPEGFIGGAQGRLRRLKVDCLWLPPVCPALATVTNLTAGLASGWLWTTGESPWSSLKLLFELMPRLESLSLSGISTVSHPHLPLEPAPRSLRTLLLEGDGCDLAQYVLAWKTEFLRDVTITTPHQNFARRGAEALFEGHLAAELDLRSCLRMSFSSIQNGISGTACTLTLVLGGTDPSNRILDAFYLLLGYHQQLAGLRDLSCPLEILCVLVSKFASPHFFINLRRARTSASLLPPSAGSDANASLQPELLSLLHDAPRFGISYIEICLQSAIPMRKADVNWIVAEIAARVQNRCEVVVTGLRSDVTCHADVGANRITFVET